MLITTVGQLREYLKQSGESPEQLAAKVQISNMTIRRWLEKQDNAPIPAKYHLQFQRLAAVNMTGDFSTLIGDLEAKGSEVKDTGKLQSDLKEKLKDARVVGELLEKVTLLTKTAFGKSSPKTKALCIGALIYFINPFDVIPDALGPIGYLDDFAVLTIVADMVFKQVRGKSS